MIRVLRLFPGRRRSVSLVLVVIGAALGLTPRTVAHYHRRAEMRSYWAERQQSDQKMAGFAHSFFQRGKGNPAALPVPTPKSRDPKHRDRKSQDHKSAREDA